MQILNLKASQQSIQYAPLPQWGHTNEADLSSFMKLSKMKSFSLLPITHCRRRKKNRTTPNRIPVHLFWCNMWKVCSSQRVERSVECVWVNLTRASPESGTSSDPSIMLLQLKSSHIKYSSFVRGPTVILPIVRIECDALESNKSRSEDNAMDSAELNMATPFLGSFPFVLSLSLTVHPSRKTTSDARSVWTYVTLLYMCVCWAPSLHRTDRSHIQTYHTVGWGETSNVVLGPCCIADNGACAPNFDRKASKYGFRLKLRNFMMWLHLLTGCIPKLYQPSDCSERIVSSRWRVRSDRRIENGYSKFILKGHARPFRPNGWSYQHHYRFGVVSVDSDCPFPRDSRWTLPRPAPSNDMPQCRTLCRYFIRKRHMFLGLDASFRLDAVVVRAGRFAHACSQLLKQWGFSKRVAPKPYPTGLRSADELQLQGQKVTFNDRKLRFRSVPLLLGQCIDSVPAGRLSRLPTARVTKDVLLCHYGSQSLRFILRRICGLSVKNVWFDLWWCRFSRHCFMFSEEYVSLTSSAAELTKLVKLISEILG